MSSGSRFYGVRGIGKAATILVGIATAAVVLAFLMPGVGRVIAEEAQRLLDEDLLAGGVLLTVAAELIYGVLYTCAGVLVIIWLWRARKNLEAFDAPTTLAAGWAIGGWFIPIVNLVIPVRVMANVARESLGRATTPALVVVWWGAFVVAWIGDVVHRVVSPGVETLPEPTDAASYQAYIDFYDSALSSRAVFAVFQFVAGIALILLIRQITKAQHARLTQPEAPKVMPGA